MYVKDIAASKGDNTCAEETIEEILNNLPDDETKAMITHNRAQ